MTESLDLSTIFKAVKRTLAENQDVLNSADTANNDHGTHMVETFDIVQKAVAKQKNKPVAEQLAYAGNVLSKKSTSGSGQIYAQGLANAAQKFIGKDLNQQTVGTLINALMGVQQPAQAQSSAVQGDLLGSLLGGLTGSQSQSQPAQSAGTGDLLGSLLGGLTGTQSQTQPAQSAGTGDLLGSLLGGLTGSQANTSGQTTGSGGTDLIGSLMGGLTGNNSQQPSQTGADLLGSLLGSQGEKPSNQGAGLDVTDLLSAGLAYFAAKQSGHSNMEAIMHALSGSSPLGNRPASTQSGALVINTILGLIGKKK